jgi:uncharacterized protein
MRQGSTAFEIDRGGQLTFVPSRSKIEGHHGRSVKAQKNRRSEDNMSILRRTGSKERLMGRIGYGSDLLEELNKMCRKKDIRLGWFEGLGAVRKVCLSYYDQQKQGYQSVEVDRPLEITHLVGNVSLRDGAPFVHAHITLADGEGRAYGGHLAPGTIVFACEFVLDVLDGPDFERALDETTGLYLWRTSGE